MMTLILGVDGGGTTTQTWLATREGAVLGRGQSGPSNAKSVGIEAARTALEESRRLAFESAGVPLGPVGVACLGLAGFDRPDDRSTLEGWIEAWADQFVLVNDAELVIAAGTPDGWGVALISGTGSICVGRTPSGRLARAGGWGHLIGDEGSAYRVAIEGLRLVAQRADGREVSPTETDSLVAGMCRAFGVDGPEAIVSRIYDGTWDRARIAALAPLVTEAARRGDHEARMLIEDEGEQLARMVGAVCERLGWIDQMETGLPLALSGGFLLHTGILQDALLENLDEMGLNVACRDVPEPVAGAVRLASRALIDV